MQRSVWHPHHLRHQFHYYNLASRRNRFLAVFLSAILLTALVIFFRSSFGFNVPGPETVGNISLGELLLSASYTFVRLLAAYTISLILAIILALLATSNSKVEGLLLPLLDVLQSVPVLAFFPIAVLAFARFGLTEGAAIFILFTGMLWPILFNIIGAIHSIPRDINYAAYNFGAVGARHLWHIILPATFPAIVTGSILAWGEGWNIIIVAEFFNFGSVREILPGLGSTLDRAAAGVGEGNTTLFLAALLVLVGIVVILNRLIWHPLLNYSERFKFD